MAEGMELEVAAFYRAYDEFDYIFVYSHVKGDSTSSSSWRPWANFRFLLRTAQPPHAPNQNSQGHFFQYT
jgi:hypothetical protein